MDPESEKAEDLPSNSGNSHGLIHPQSPFPDEVLEKVLSFIDSHKDRSSISLVRKDWYNAERWTRSKLFIGNCYAVSPEIVARRFRRIKSVTLKGKPRFSDFNMLPLDWGANVHSWLVMFAKVYPFLEELRLKRMTVTDESLELLAKSFPDFKALSLSSCDGFSENGLKAIASHCRCLLLRSFIELPLPPWIIAVYLLVPCMNLTCVALVCLTVWFSLEAKSASSNGVLNYRLVQSVPNIVFFVLLLWFDCVSNILLNGISNYHKMKYVRFSIRKRRRWLAIFVYPL